MDHQFYTAADMKDEPEDSSLARHVCEGGLAICKVCGIAEGALTTHCPGEPSGRRADDVYTRKTDYVDGCWTTLTQTTSVSEEAVIARYRDEQIRDNFGSPAEFLQNEGSH